MIAFIIKVYGIYIVGIQGKLLRIIRDMYKTVKSRVLCCSDYSDFFEFEVVLKQGEVISPIMFYIFLEDLELVLNDRANSGPTSDDITFILMLFADDMVMVILSNSPEDLQNSLNVLESYCDNWGVSVNVEKSKVMVLGKIGGVRTNE